MPKRNSISQRHGQKKAAQAVKHYPKQHLARFHFHTIACIPNTLMHMPAHINASARTDTHLALMSLQGAFSHFIQSESDTGHSTAFVVTLKHILANALGLDDKDFDPTKCGIKVSVSRGNCEDRVARGILEPLCC